MCHMFRKPYCAAVIEREVQIVQASRWFMLGQVYVLPELMVLTSDAMAMVKETGCG